MNLALTVLFVKTAFAGVICLWECNSMSYDTAIEMYGDTKHGILQKIFVNSWWFIPEKLKEIEPHSTKYTKLIEFISKNLCDVVKIQDEVERYIDETFIFFGLDVKTIKYQRGTINRKISHLLAEMNDKGIVFPKKPIPGKRFDQYADDELYYFHFEYFLFMLFAEKADKIRSNSENIHNAYKTMIPKTQTPPSYEIKSALTRLEKRKEFANIKFCLDEIMQERNNNVQFISRYKSYMQDRTCIIYPKQYTELYKRMFTKYLKQKKERPLESITRRSTLEEKLRYVLDETKHINNILNLGKRLESKHKTEVIILNYPGFYYEFVRTMEIDGVLESSLETQRAVSKHLFEFDGIYDSIIVDLFAPKNATSDE